ncbi:SIR2 family protein [Gynuella sunshinyii]|uniref:Uncharacterized protein n=1 Tax=Gynuella sunshinyii YC6258 TaxID=1445510 RepID=A0A0C5VU67_9GAMM|nr:SIR2 family protein [Gynuella sunshinyii]AJQ93939.1 hypothetical Protein YC6258_01895 [Gynuella sunshinyii YC6258]
MDIQQLECYRQQIEQGHLIPYIGPGTLRGVINQEDGTPIPADSDSLILAMNNGRPMAPKLMYEFPRAAMNLELKRGRSFVERFLTQTYGEKQWSVSALHQWIASLNAPYIIDINRDTQLQNLYADREYILVVGCARLSGTQYRFQIYHHSHGNYQVIEQHQVNPDLPVLFKPMGTPLPSPCYIASDADYVDYITELMGGFAIPAFLKLRRQNKQYLLLGMHLNRDTERMVFSDIIYGANEQLAGWALIENANDKERRYCSKKQIEVIDLEYDPEQEAVEAVFS